MSLSLEDADLLQKGLEAKGKKDLFTAINYLRKFMAGNPLHVEGICNLAICLHRVREYEAAEKLYEYIFSKTDQKERVTQYKMEMYSAFFDIENYRKATHELLSLMPKEHKAYQYNMLYDFSLPYGLTTQEVDSFYKTCVEKANTYFSSKKTCHDVAHCVPDFWASVTYDVDAKAYHEALSGVIYQLYALDKIEARFDIIQENARKNKKILFFNSVLTYSLHATSRYYLEYAKALSRAGFDVIIMQTPAASPKTSLKGITIVDTSHNLSEICMMIYAINPHMIIYPEVVETTAAFILSNTRLAPIQCVLGSTPLTTGRKNIDYFVGSEIFDVPDPQPHYTEKFISIPHFSIYYEYLDPLKSVKTITRQDYGLPEKCVLYVCVQNGRKMTPESLDVFIELLRKDPDGIFAYVDMATFYFGEKVNQYFSEKAPDLKDRIFPLLEATGRAYYGLLYIADVVLDTKFCCGGVTTFDCASLHQPVVCFEMPYLRGRVSAAIQRHMGLDDIIATTNAEYIEIAMRLAHDQAFRHQMRAILKKNKMKIFKQMDGVNAFVAWTKDVLDASFIDSFE